MIVARIRRCAASAPLLAAVALAGCCKANSKDPPSVGASADNPVGVKSPGARAPGGAAEGDEEGYQSNGFPRRMPRERTPVPTVKEWSAAPLVTTKKLPDGCSMKFVREWLKINCSKDTNTLVPIEVTNVTGMGGNGADYFLFAKSGSVVDIVVRTVDGKKGTANFVTDRGTFLVGYDWPYRAPFPSTVFQ
jgi:hypothetical protein